MAVKLLTRIKSRFPGFGIDPALSKSFGKGLDWAASQCFWIRLREVEGDYAWYDCTIIMGHILWHGNSQIHTT